MQKLALTLAFLMGLVTLAVAQAPPPVPALPDAQRLTSYSLSSSTCACSVGFQIYGDGTDVDQWIDVFVNGVSYQSTDPMHGWSLSSPTGSLGNIPRPITNAILTFASPQTGAVTIVGARRPRRLSQFPESRGVSARDFNQVLTDIIATQREIWDQSNRTIRGQPGDVFNPLPPAAARSSQFLAFDSSGTLALVPPPGSSSGGGPIFSSGIPAAGSVAVWQDTTHLIGTINLSLSGTVSALNSTPPASFTTPSYSFNDNGVAGFNFPDTQTHFGTTITGNSPSTGTGSYGALAVTQFGSGRDASAFVTGAVMQATATGGAGNYSGDNPFTVICGTAVLPGQCPFGTAANVNTSVGIEADLFDFTGATIGNKEGIRIADLGQVQATNYSAGIVLVKSSGAPGFQYGILFGEPGIADFPIVAGGNLMRVISSTGIAAAFDFSTMPDNGFTSAAMVLTEGAKAINWTGGPTILGSTTPTQLVAVQFPGGTNGLIVQSTGIVLPTLPTSAGGGGLTLCVDSAGVVYKKATCP